MQGATVLSFAACKAQEAQDALHAATPLYAAHADPEVRPYTRCGPCNPCATSVLASPARLTDGLTYTQGQLMLEDAKEHQQATLEIVSLLLAHGGDSDELYTPVSTTSAPYHTSASFIFCRVKNGLGILQCINSYSVTGKWPLLTWSLLT